MGYSVAIMADSTFALGRSPAEMSGRLEEMPGTKAIQPILAAGLLEYYERAGRVKTLGSTARERLYYRYRGRITSGWRYF